MNYDALDAIEDDLDMFADDKGESQNTIQNRPWKILIVDDEIEVHRVTEMVLGEVVFENASLEMISAFSGREAAEILKKQDDIAVVLLDVVMEKDTTGLETVRYIREELGNRTSRIILRTGQPGIAPKDVVIMEYDINDYREKTELTAQTLLISVVSALRSYRDIQLLEKSRSGMRNVITSSAKVFHNQGLHAFSETILRQLTFIPGRDDLICDSFVAVDLPEGLTIEAGRGAFEEFTDRAVPEMIVPDIEELMMKGNSVFEENHFVCVFELEHGIRHVLYLKSERPFDELEMDLIRIFCNNIEIAYDNIYLTKGIIDAQKDIILRMGDVVETRSKETANHVYRVAEFSYLLAKKVGVSEEKAQILRHASPMHDVGKVGIPDSILLKPDKLTEDEFEIMKTHTTLGHSIFQKSDREIIRAAATIAHEHHERWDGNGYPRGIAGEEIHIFGRITSLADVFDALSSRRSYKKAWDESEVFAFISDQSGAMFDPALVELFLGMKEQLMEIRRLYPDS